MIGTVGIMSMMPVKITQSLLFKFIPEFMYSNKNLYQYAKIEKILDL